MLSSSGVRGYQVIVFTEAVQKVKQMDKKTIRVRGVQLGTGSPRICVPVVAENETQLRAVLGKMTAQEQSSGRIWDLVEYRADYLSELNEAQSAGGGVPGNNSALIYRKISNVSFRRFAGQREIFPCSLRSGHRGKADASGEALRIIAR